MTRFVSPSSFQDITRWFIRFVCLPVLLFSLMILSLGASDVFAAKDGPYRISTFSCDTSPPKDGHPLIWLVRVKTIETPLLAKGVVIENGKDRYVLCASIGAGCAIRRTNCSAGSWPPGRASMFRTWPSNACTHTRPPTPTATPRSSWTRSKTSPCTSTSSFSTK